jgi:hypothetical protein
VIFELTTQIHVQEPGSKVDDKFRRYFHGYGFEFEIIYPSSKLPLKDEELILFTDISDQSDDADPAWYLTVQFSTQGGETTRTLSCPFQLNQQSLSYILGQELAKDLDNGGLCLDTIYSPLKNPSEYVIFQDLLAENSAGKRVDDTEFQEFTNLAMSGVFKWPQYSHLQLQAIHAAQAAKGRTSASWAVSTVNADGDPKKATLSEVEIWQSGNDIGRECHVPLVFIIDENCREKLDSDLLALFANPSRFLSFYEALKTGDDDFAWDVFFLNSGFSVVPATGSAGLAKNKIKLQRNRDLQNFTLTRERPDDQGFQIVHELSCRLEKK